MSQLKHLYECSPKLSDGEILLMEIAEKYVRDAEAYDRTVCTGPIRDGEVMPADYHELRLVNQNAQSLLDQFCSNNPQFTRAEIRHAISKADRYRAQ